MNVLKTYARDLHNEFTNRPFAIIDENGQPRSPSTGPVLSIPAGQRLFLLYRRAP